MISDGIYFRNVIIQALNDLVLESFIFLVCSLSAFVFGFVWGVFFAMYFCVLGNKLTSSVCRILEGSVYPWCHRKTKLLYL